MYLDTTMKAWDVCNTLAFHPLSFFKPMRQILIALVLLEVCQVKKVAALPSSFSELTQILSLCNS